eukprot:3277865-Amphidinium_carterae.1
MSKTVYTNSLYLILVRKLLLCPERYWYAVLSSLLDLYKRHGRSDWHNGCWRRVAWHPWRCCLRSTTCKHASKLLIDPNHGWKCSCNSHGGRANTD